MKDINKLLLESSVICNLCALKAYLKAGADANAQNEYGDTALMWAARYENTECVKALIDAGAEVNAKHNDGYTAFISAAEYGHAEFLKALLYAGADVGAKDNDGWTALILAALEGYTQCVKLIEDHINKGSKTTKLDKAIKLLQEI